MDVGHLACLGMGVALSRRRAWWSDIRLWLALGLGLVAWWSFRQ